MIGGSPMCFEPEVSCCFLLNIALTSVNYFYVDVMPNPVMKDTRQIY